MAAGFGLLAALFWGLSDFLISVAGRCLAAIGFGVQFWLQGRFVGPRMGSKWPVWRTCLFSAAILSLVALAHREPIRLEWPALLTNFATGACGVGGLLSLSAGFAGPALPEVRRSK